MTEEAIKKEILVAFEYSYLHDDWVNPLEEALSGLDYVQAQWRPSPESKSIWEIVLHMAVWHENIVERTRTGQRARPAEGAWPALPDPADEAAFENSKRRLWDALGSVREMIETSTLDQLQAGPYGLGDLFCRFTHNAYHLGQITKMRECMEARP